MLYGFSLSILMCSWCMSLGLRGIVSIELANGHIVQVTIEAGSASACTNNGREYNYIWSTEKPVVWVGYVCNWADSANICALVQIKGLRRYTPHILWRKILSGLNFTEHKIKHLYIVANVELTTYLLLISWWFSNPWCQLPVSWY